MINPVRLARWLESKGFHTTISSDGIIHFIDWRKEALLKGKEAFIPYHKSSIICYPKEGYCLAKLQKTFFKPNVSGEFYTTEDSHVDRVHFLVEWDDGIARIGADIRFPNDEKRAKEVLSNFFSI